MGRVSYGSGGSTQLPLFEPHSDWKPIDMLPDLSGAKYIGFDVETKDPHLMEAGPGSFRKDGHIVGISLATDLGHKMYLPIRHPGAGNLDLGLVKRYVKEQLSRENQIKVGANILYDQEWLKSDLGIDVKGQIYDVLIAEPLIDTNQKKYNLERLANLYTGQGKEYEQLVEAVQAYCGPKATTKVRANIWKLPAKHVGAYAEADSTLPIEIFLKQKEILERENLWDIFMLETRVTPILLKMRFAGVPVDTDKAERTHASLKIREKEAQKKLDSFVGVAGVNVWSGDHLQKAYDKAGEYYPRTEAGNASFTKQFLEGSTTDVAKMILSVRRLSRLGETFIKGIILKHAINGRIHGQFHQMKSDEGGTITGRFSSSNPNLQQIPARDEEIAPLIRSIFVPEEGCEWHSNDYSQVEPRIQVHYAAISKMNGADIAVDKYTNDSTTDFHQMTADITGLSRKKAKNVHLGLSYGMGLAKLADTLGTTVNEAREIKEEYNKYMPFLQGISDYVNNTAANRGWIRTLLGRRFIYDTWEPAGKDSYGKLRGGLPVGSRQEALEKYGNPVRRAGTRKAFNALSQGSAADVMKKAMVDIHEAGLLDECTLHVTIHDELGISIDPAKREIAREIVHRMSTCVKMAVPLKVDNEVGPSWGEAK